MYQPNDARDIAHCIVCALQSDTALGEAFNGGAPEPFSFVDGARLLGEIRGIEPLEIKLPVRNIYDHAIGKAKSMIGYQPKGDLSTMMASAKRCKDGETDYTWEDSLVLRRCNNTLQNSSFPNRLPKIELLLTNLSSTQCPAITG